LIATLLAVALATAPPPARSVQAAQGTTVSPEGLLNPDGTLDRSTGFQGALDLRGWQVTLDADAVGYDVYLEPNDVTPDVLVSDDQTGLAYDPPTLAVDTHYYWQIIATDEHGASTPGPVWDFTTTSGGLLPDDMVFVPAGSFQMGCDPVHNGGYSCQSDELPLHTVTLDAYIIDKYEVTNAQYAGFLNAMGNQEEGGVTWLETGSGYVRIHQLVVWAADAGYEDHPAIEVTWYGARAYCQWGDAPPGCTLANANYCVGGGSTTQVGSYPAGASPYGALDMGGNVYEWVNDWYAPDYYDITPASNPQGPDSDTYKVQRGGNSGSDWLRLRVAERAVYSPTGTLNGTGFRCAGDAVPEIQVLDGATSIADGTGAVNFGAIPVGTPIDKTFTVSNTGTVTLTLTEPISVPTGFSVANSFGDTTMTAGNSTTFSVRLDAVAVGTYTGTLQFANNDADEDPFNFTISGSATTLGYFLPAILRHPGPLTTLYVTNQTTGLVLYYTVHGTPEGDITCTNIPAGTTAWCGRFTPGTYEVSVDTAECGPSSGPVVFAAGSTTRIVSCQ